jgi:hypothetical protein
LPSVVIDPRGGWKRGRGPDWREFPQFPVCAGAVAFATLVSLAMWAGRDVRFLFADAHVGRFELWRLLTCALRHVNVLGIAYERTGRPREAAAAFERAYRLEPTKPSFRRSYETGR